jgi:hypothetical protein
VLTAAGLAAAAGAPTRDPPRHPADSVPATITLRARRLIRLLRTYLTMPFPQRPRDPGPPRYPGGLEIWSCSRGVTVS